jgi:PAS domain S-box-containing protein
MVLELTQNIGLLVALAVVLQMVARRVTGRRLTYALTSGVLFGIVGVAGMMATVHFEPGVIYDGRSIVLSIAGIFGGPITVSLAAAICGAYRLHLGGAGALPGIAVIIEAAVLGLGLHYLRQRNERWIRPLALLSFGVLVHVIMLLLQLLLPGGMGWEVLHTLGLVVVVIYPLAFLVTAQVFLDEERRRSAEETLRISEEHYRNLFDGNCAAMMIVDPNSGAIVNANAAACIFYGWPHDELVAKHITDINTLSAPQVQAEMARAKASQRNRFFFRHRIADGSTRDVEVFSGPIRLEGQDRLFSIIHDISERRRAEEALAERERQLATLMDNLPGMAYRCLNDRDWSMLFVSDGAYALTGYRPEELQHNARVSYISLIHPDDREYVWAEVQRSINASRPFILEYRLIDAAGRERWVWEQGRGTLSPAGEQMVEGFVCDMTERKVAEERVDHLNLVLRAIRDVNQLIVRERDSEALIREACRLITIHRSYTSALIILTDTKGGPASWAQAGLGEDFAALVTSLESGVLPICCRMAVSAEIPFLLTGRHRICSACPVWTSHPQGDTLCIQLKHGDAVYGYLAVTLAHELGADEEEQGLFCEMAADLAYALNAFENRAARTRAEQDREHMQQQLLQSQKMEAVGQLAGGVAHDFNNILQAVMGYAQILIDTASTTKQPCEELEEIYKGAERAAALTRQLLAFSRRQVIRPTPLDLNQLMENLLNMLARIIGEHIRLEWLPGNHLGSVQGDAGMLEQVLMNLCLNARDAMEDGGVLTIETQNVRIDSEYCNAHAWARPGRYVLLSVTDTGCGMDSKTLARIFEPFFTTKAEGKGTGLGLAMVYGIVKQHEGMIGAYSEVGKGTTLKIYLPACEQHAETLGPMIQGIASGGTETILLAEDDPGVRKLAQTVLERAGYSVLTAKDGEEAVSLFAQHADNIALIILDVVMPRVGGHKALEQIRALRPEARAIFSSGYSENAVHTNFVLHEGLRLIQKPYAPEALLHAVRDALDGNAAPQN